MDDVNYVVIFFVLVGLGLGRAHRTIVRFHTKKSSEGQLKHVENIVQLGACRTGRLC